MKPSKPSPKKRHQWLSQSLTLPSTPGSTLAFTPGIGVGLGVQRHRAVLQPGPDHGGAPAGEHGVIDPAFGAFRITDAPPGFEFGGDLHRQAGAGEHPGDALVLARAGADIDLVGLEADESRHRQAAGAAHRAIVLRLRARRGESARLSSRPRKSQQRQCHDAAPRREEEPRRLPVPAIPHGQTTCPSARLSAAKGARPGGSVKTAACRPSRFCL